MSSIPLCSIVIPCFNKQAYVASAIKSALAQGDIAEVVVIDDGSTDASLDEIRRFDGRIIWETGLNRGGSAARNRGLALSRGQFIQFLDADDLLPKGKLAKQLAVLMEEDASTRSLAFCPWSTFHDNGCVDSPIPQRYWHTFQNGIDLLLGIWTYGGFFPPHAWLTPRILIDAAGPWDERLTGDDDGEFFGRVLIQASQVFFTSNTHVLYRDPPEGAVSRDTSLVSVRSRWAAFEQICHQILVQRSDRRARRAVLSRLRRTAYGWSGFPEIVDAATELEKEAWLLDLSPSLPVGMQFAMALLGIRRGLAVRRMLKT
jgi:glycosyltransferase involved in cell wall biosynthesis